MKNAQNRFQSRHPQNYRNPDSNPYLKIHHEYGPPVIVAEDAPSFRGQWARAFGGRDAPLHLEIGPGNGFFLSGMAQRHPNTNWLGIEIRFKRVVLCARKIDAEGVKNARIARYDAWCLDDLFEPGELSCLITHHPDPWPRARHAARRLSGPEFAAWASRALKPGGLWRMKTDYHPHIISLQKSIADLPFQVTGRVDDVRLNGVPWPEDEDVVTNYQRKFYEKNEPIYAIELSRE